MIKDWSTSAPHSHLAGGMTYNDGKLTVPTSGRYYIYAQLYYHSNGRVCIYVNNKTITMLQPPTAGSSHGTLYAGGVFNLKAGDAISLIPCFSIKIFMYSFHSYFGAFLIWASLLHANRCERNCTISSLSKGYKAWFWFFFLLFYQLSSYAGW